MFQLFPQLGHFCLICTTFAAILTVGATLKENYRTFANPIEGIEAGDIMETPRRDFLLAVDKDYYYRFSIEPCPFQAVIWFNLRSRAQDFHSKIIKEARKVENQMEDTRRMRLAVASRIAGKRVPYHLFACNKYHWWNYILRGKTHTNWLNKKSCPLARSWKGHSVESVFLGHFSFQDGQGNEYKFGADYNVEGHPVNCGVIGRYFYKRPRHWFFKKCL